MSQLSIATMKKTLVLLNQVNSDLKKKKKRQYTVLVKKASVYLLIYLFILERVHYLENLEKGGFM